MFKISSDWGNDHGNTNQIDLDDTEEDDKMVTVDSSNIWQAKKKARC